MYWNDLPLWMYNGQRLYIAHKMNNENTVEQDNLIHKLKRHQMEVVEHCLVNMGQ